MANYYNPYMNYPQYQTQQTIQSGGFVSVPTVEQARSYPVAPGNSVTFKIENAPYICTKTQGFSPLDVPVFEKYRLIKEDDTPVQQNHAQYALKTDLDKISNELEAIKKELGYEPSTGNSASHGNASTISAESDAISD